jgi:hypothetical protein
MQRVSVLFWIHYFGYLEKMPKDAEEQGEDKTMAASITANFPIPVSMPVASSGSIRMSRRRHITPRAGHALEILGHAIEYLTDEFVHNTQFAPGKGQLEAVQLLMAVNRQVYYECPELPTFAERLRSVLGRRAA